MVFCLPYAKCDDILRYQGDLKTQSLDFDAYHVCAPIVIGNRCNFLCLAMRFLTLLQLEEDGSSEGVQLLQNTSLHIKMVNKPIVAFMLIPRGIQRK